MTSIPNQRLILRQHPPRNHPLRPLPRLQPLRNLPLPNPINPNLISLAANSNRIPIPDHRNRPPHSSLGNHMPHNKAMAGARVPPIRHECHVGEFSAHERGAGFQLLGHAGTALGALVADDDDDVGGVRDFAVIECLVELVLLIEDARDAGESRSLLAGNLCDGAAWGEVAAEDLQMACGFYGVGKGADDDLVLGQGGEGGDVLGEGLSCYGGDAAV